MPSRTRFVVTWSLSAVAILAAILPAGAATPPVGIVGQFNQPMCDSNGYERVKTLVTEYAVSDSSGTCVRAEKHHPVFAVSSVTRAVAWQYPNIASGYTSEGETTCANPERDTCFGYPVQADHDGVPEESFASWISGGYEGNLSNDIWFSPARDRHSVAHRAGDTELMIWFAYPGIDDRSHFIAYATIDHMRFGIMSWVTRAPHRYVAYLWLNAPRVGRGGQVNISGLWLNPFFRNAEAHGWLRPDEWLWAVDLGFEMNRGGQGNNIHDFALSSVG